MTVRGRDEMLALAAAALERAGEASAEIAVQDVDSSLSRFAGNRIHQNVAERGMRWRARVIEDSRVAVATVSGAAREMGRQVVDAARETLGVMPETDVTPLPAADGGPDQPVAFSEETAAADPEQRADMVETIVRAARAAGLEAYGYVSTHTTTTAIANTRGLRRAATSTQCGAVAVMRGTNGAGYAARHHAAVGDVDCAELADEAVDTCRRNQDAESVEPGDYEVVFSPYAVTEMLFHLGWIGFSALAVQEQRSFVRIGERLMSEQVTIRDDPRTADLFPFPFDAEGVTAQVVTLVDRGVCAGLVYDTPTALRDGVRSTGHSLPQPNTWGPLAVHLTMDGGEGTADELIGGVKRGLYVNRLWYVRDVDARHTIITGMTREGTFLIENGRLGRAVRDLRFTQSIVDALSDVRGVSAARRAELDENDSGVLAPWLHVGHFSFTS